MKSGLFRQLTVVALLLGAIAARATSVTVQELGLGANRIVNISIPEFYSGGARAGVIKLLVDGQPMDAFCIDPFHFSSHQPLAYERMPLSEAPKASQNPFYPGGMGLETAASISKLWAMYYSPAMTANLAAGVQLAIWELVGGANFTLNSADDYGAAGLLASLSSSSVAPARLLALSGPGQDYLIPNVPDTGLTFALLGLTSLGFVVLRSRRTYLF